MRGARRAAEITVDAAEISLLAKGRSSHRQKNFTGLKMSTSVSRHREQDLVASPKTRDALRARYESVAAMRQYLNERGFIEAETPVLQTIAGGALARPFITHHNAVRYAAFICVSATELHLKPPVVIGVAFVGKSL